MTFDELIRWTPAAVSACCAVYVTVRTQNWRDTDDARAIVERFKSVEDRVLKVEIAQKHMPTQETIAALSQQVALAAHSAKNAEDGINRIEQMFVEAGFKAR